MYGYALCGIVPSVILLSPSLLFPPSLHHSVESLVVAITCCYLSSILPPVLFFLSVPSPRSPAAISRFSPRLPFTESSEFPSLLPISATSVEIMHEKATMAISSHNRALFLLVAAAPCIPSETPLALHLQQRPGTDKASADSWRSLQRLDDRRELSPAIRQIATGSYDQ